MMDHPMTTAAVGVSILVASFSPQASEVLKGDTVTWSNDSNRQHTVTAVDGSFASPTVFTGDRYAHEFDASGAIPYFCTIHPFMRGEVDVVAAALSGPAAPAFAGEPVELHGRAPAGTASVDVVPGGTVTPAADGTFAYTVRPRQTTTYTAVTAAGQSPPVTVAVSDAVTLTVTVTRRAVRVRTAPARPGLVAVVQRWARWRYDWRPAASAQLDARGAATIPLAAMTGKARVILAPTVKGRPLLEGRALHLRTGRPTQVP
jgi:plastocyanin